MGRPPCCDKVGIKKGPWTPEEDIILVSYIQEHGPGNWRSVPTNTGLLRCSKSCRLRWTNYLRPGIKRGNFTPQEEGMIIHLQALLGNKWAAIASYLPQRTDNDIKNYWNTHLKKRLKKFQSTLDTNMAPQDSSTATTTSQRLSKITNSLNERRSPDLVTTSTSSTLKPNNQTPSIYASSTENISRLLGGWMRSSPKPTSTTHRDAGDHPDNIGHNLLATTASSSLQCYRPKDEIIESGGSGGGDLIPREEFESILLFENLNNVSWDKSSTRDSSAVGVSTTTTTTTTTTKGCQLDCASDEKDNKESDQRKHKSDHGNPPLSFLEKWLLDENSTAQVEEASELSSIF